MAQITELQATGTPGRRRVFVAKEADITPGVAAKIYNATRGLAIYNSARGLAIYNATRGLTVYNAK